MRSIDPMTRCILTLEHKIMKHYNSQSNVTVDNRAHPDIALFLLKMTRIISLTCLMRNILYIYLFCQLVRDIYVVQTVYLLVKVKSMVQPGTYL
jgi:hypothetical protein